MTQLELLNKIPKEHWTTHNNKPIQVSDLIKILTKKNKKKK